MMNNRVKFKLQHLPNSPGVYQYKDINKRVVYIGKAKNLRLRVRSYFRSNNDNNQKTKILVSKISDIDTIITSSEVEAIILENNLIKKFKPRYNISLKDDKSYPYISITNEPFPRVFWTRNIKRDGSKYFGPYTDAKQMKLALDVISQTFKVRSCSLNLKEENIKKKKFRVCLDYHINKCKGPCEGYQSEESYNEMIVEIKKILKGKAKDVLHTLEKRMKDAADELRFEDAHQLKKEWYALRKFTQRQKVLSVEQVDRDVIAVATKERVGCGVIFKVRNGVMVGSMHYYATNIEGESLSKIISRLLEKHYVEIQESSPSEILVQADIELEIKNSLIKLIHQIDKEVSGNSNAKNVSILKPLIGDKLKLVNMCLLNASQLLNEYLAQKKKRYDTLSIPHSVHALQRDLRLKRLPSRIECFDNSNLQGTDPVASMVCFVNGKPKKSDYRKFKIRSVQGPDDFSSMAEVISRRYTGSLSQVLPLPDLIIVDGGKGQLSVSYAVLEKHHINVPIISLAKKLEEVFQPNELLPYNLPKSSSSLKLLQQLRDEAHRFAITYHRNLRTKRTLQSQLLDIKGVGKETAQKLIIEFGSVEGIRNSREEDLLRVVGSKLASKIVEFLR